MEFNNNTNGMQEVICRYVVRNGRKIYPRNAKYFHFWVKDCPCKAPQTKQLSMFDNVDVI